MFVTVCSIVIYSRCHKSTPYSLSSKRRQYSFCSNVFGIHSRNKKIKSNSAANTASTSLGSNGKIKVELASKAHNDESALLLNNHESEMESIVELFELRARGRFGCLYRALDKHTNSVVAVKVFSQQHALSWLNEQRIYRMECMRTGHPGLLKFIDAQHLRFLNETNEIVDEYRIISEFHEQGSLHDLLKDRTVSVNEMLRIAVTMSAGLSYMHQSSTVQTMAGKISPHKSKFSIAHRDFKSKNVLIKADMTACVADFGLALVLDRHLGEIHSQVGTPRYMAPEVLEGAISFTPAAFLCIDAFALSMVLWELLSRLEVDDGKPNTYQLPFEDLVGLNPTVAEIKDIVVFKRQRPPFADYLEKNKVAALVIETIRDCWDQDAESRLTVMCAYNQIMV
ncbi:hypothetical protein ACOME3_008142 [Neoechinorhynchus agilis]